MGRVQSGLEKYRQALFFVMVTSVGCGGSGTNQRADADPNNGRDIACTSCKADQPTTLDKLVLDEVTYPVSGKLTVNGVKPHKSKLACDGDNQLANIVFRRAGSTIPGWEASATIDCTTTDFSWSTALAPGTYEVRVLPGGAATTWEVDLSPVAYLASTTFAVMGPTSGVVFDEKTHLVSGTVQVNGKAPTSTLTDCDLDWELAIVRFIDKAHDYDTSVSITCSDGSYPWQVALPDGTYDIRVARGSDADDWKVNLLRSQYLAKAGLVVSSGSGDLSGIVLDEATSKVSGTLTLDGEIPSTSSLPCSAGYAIASIIFSEKTKGFEIWAGIDCSTKDFSWTTQLPNGTYEIRAIATYAFDTLPSLPVLVRSALTVGGPQAGVKLDYASYPVTGSLTVNGAPPPQKLGNCGAAIDKTVITFIDKAKANTFRLDRTCATSEPWSADLPAGTYEVRVQRGPGALEGTGELADGDYLVDPALVISGPTNGVILDEKVYTASGKLTVAGKTPANGKTPCTTATPLAHDVARVTFTDQAKGFTTSATIGCDTKDFAWQKRLPAGTYEVRIERRPTGAARGVDLLPVLYLADAALTLNGDKSGLVYNEVGTLIEGVVRVNGALPTLDAAHCTAPGDSVYVSFVDESQGYAAPFYVPCDSPDFSFSVRLPAGHYSAYLDLSTPVLTDIVVP